jgi:hypothetical protein
MRLPRGHHLAWLRDAQLSLPSGDRQRPHQRQWVARPIFIAYKSYSLRPPGPRTADRYGRARIR